jgi:ribosomal protein S18 acetylase RimI-like enzyme
MLVDATQDHIREMLAWFPNRLSCVTWGGPGFRFPFTPDTFFEDSRARSLPSYALVAESGALLGFGQYYLRAGRCHLSRLAIEPQMRGRGLGTRLIALLVALGAAKLGVEQCSLFVSTLNPRAQRLYERLGFELASYPEAGLALPESHYMIAGVRSIEALT